MSGIVNVVINPLQSQRFCAYKKGKKGDYGKLKHLRQNTVNNETDTEPGPYAINVSQVIQFSRRPLLTFNFPFNPASWDALYYTFDCGNLVLAMKLM